MITKNNWELVLLSENVKMEVESTTETWDDFDLYWAATDTTMGYLSVSACVVAPLVLSNNRCDLLVVFSRVPEGMVHSRHKFVSLAELFHAKKHISWTRLIDAKCVSAPSTGANFVPYLHGDFSRFQLLLLRAAWRPESFVQRDLWSTKLTTDAKWYGKPSIL